MTPPSHMTELADRVQALTSACRETDGDIWMLLNPSRVKDWTAPNGVSIHGYARRTAPAYTSSLDAAESLAPDNTEIIQYWILGKKPCVSARRGEWYVHVNAETKVGALLSAILRARAALENSHD